MEDDILQQVRAAREAIARKYNYDIHAIAEHMRQLDAADDRPVVRLAPRRPEGHEADAGAEDVTMIPVPTRLVPRVRALIAEAEES